MVRERIMANKHKLTKRQVRQAIEGSAGNITVIAERLQVHRNTVSRYLKRFPDLAALLPAEKAEGRRYIVELAETKLIKKLEEENERMIMFALRHYDTDGVPGAVSLDALFSEDVIEIMRQRGVEASDVVKAFEAMVRAQAEKQLK